MDMHSLQASLEAIERMCTLEKAHAQSGKKASHKNKAGAKWPSTGAKKQAPKKVNFEWSCELCKKHGGAHTTYTTKDCCRYEKDGMVKANFHTAKKAGVRNPIQWNSRSPSWARNWINWRRHLPLKDKSRIWQNYFHLQIKINLYFIQLFVFIW